MSEEVPKLSNVSEDFRAEMNEAGSYEELKACWMKLDEELEISNYDRFGTGLKTRLGIVHNLFTRDDNNVCDTHAFAILEDPALLEELNAVGISRKFLLQTVRVGAVIDLYRSISGDGKHKPVLNMTDNPLALSGFNRADEMFKELVKAEEAEVVREKELAKQQEDVRKKELVVRMKGPTYNLEEDEKKLIEQDIKFLLRSWKSYLTTYSEQLGAYGGGGEFAEQEITPESFEAFEAVCKECPKIWERENMVNLVNPDSGWFYVLKKNEVKTFGQFISSCHNNFNDWFEL